MYETISRTVGAQFELTNGEEVEIAHIDHHDGVVHLETLETFPVDGYGEIESPQEYIVPLELLGDVSEAPF